MISQYLAFCKWFSRSFIGHCRHVETIINLINESLFRHRPLKHVTRREQGSVCGHSFYLIMLIFDTFLDP